MEGRGRVGRLIVKARQFVVVGQCKRSDTQPDCLLPLPIVECSEPAGSFATKSEWFTAW